MLQRTTFNQLRWAVTCPHTSTNGFFSPLSLQRYVKVRTCWNMHRDGDFKRAKTQKWLNPAFWLSLYNNEKRWPKSLTTGFNLWVTVIMVVKMKLNLVKSHVQFLLFPKPKRKKLQYQYVTNVFWKSSYYRKTSWLHPIFSCTIFLTK